MKRFYSNSKLHSGEKGFTLIELLIVIVILGILSAVAIPQVTKFIAQGKASAAAQELALINTAMGAEMADAQVSGLALGTTPPTGCITGTSAFGTVVVSKTVDFTIVTSAGTYTLSSYIAGGLTAIKGTYSFNTSGVATQVTTGQ